MKSARWILAIIVTVAAFYWKILFTKQFSILWQWEPVTQSYSWYHFAAATIQKGIIPLWDPFRFSGNSFIGEMDTGLFYPLKFLAYFASFDGNGLLSERIYNELYVLGHMLAAIFTFFLARHFRLSRFSSFVAGLAFSLGGYLGNTGHPHTFDSGIWLPLIVLFFLKAVAESFTTRAVFFAAAAGLGLGMAVLGGGLHMVIMDGIVIGGMAIMLSFRGENALRVLALAATVAVVGFLFGAVQLLPSLEYAPLAFRWVGGDSPIRALDKVPYQYLGEIARFSPRAIFAFLFGGVDPGDHFPTNYFGILPLFMCVIGTWLCWREIWVKYFAVLGVLTFLYSWGGFSLLHGLLYLLPGLDMAREAGRFIHITNFAMAILAGYGIDRVFQMSSPYDHSLRSFVRGVRWLVIFLAAVLMAGSLQSTITIRDWSFMSFFLIAASYVLLEIIFRGYGSNLAKAALVFLLLWDAYEFNWIVRDKEIAQAARQDEMAILVKSRKLADFLLSRNSLFRIHFEGEAPPNIGDAYGIHMTGGMSSTMLADYTPHLGHPKMAQLMNVRYTLRRTDLPGKNPVFTDGEWRVYENPVFGPRAWVVHQVEVDTSPQRPLRRLDEPGFQPDRIAILDRQPEAPIEPQIGPHPGSVENIRYEPNSMEFKVATQGRGLMVISELFYPGWQAEVNGIAAPIYRVDGFLRGVVVPDGGSTVRLEYRPLSVQLGAALSLLALLGTALLGVLMQRKGTGTPPSHRALAEQLETQRT